jgi:hypothetical protein
MLLLRLLAAPEAPLPLKLSGPNARRIFPFGRQR